MLRPRLLLLLSEDIVITVTEEVAISLDPDVGMCMRAARGTVVTTASSRFWRVVVYEFVTVFVTVTVAPVVVAWTVVTGVVYPRSVEQYVCNEE